MLYLLTFEARETETLDLLPWEIREAMDPDTDFETVDQGLVWVDGGTETGEPLEDSAADAVAYLLGRCDETPDQYSVAA